MNVLTHAEWDELSQAIAFVANSLLRPVTQMPAHGLVPGFWDRFPVFGNAKAEQGVAALKAYAESLSDASDEEAERRCAVEITGLFLNGGSSSFVPPWETMHRNGKTRFGYGEATVDMRNRLAALGLKVSADNNQYADHIAIELLLLAELCRRRALAGDEGAGDEAIGEFVQARVGSWIGEFHEKVGKAWPDGYADGLLTIAEGLVETARDSADIRGLAD